MDGTPFGTAGGVFGYQNSTVRIFATFSPGAEWGFEYESEGEAEASMETLRIALDYDHPISERLRNEYSGPNMRDFLKEFLPRPIAFLRGAIVTVDVYHGAREQTRDGYRPLNAEDVWLSSSFKELDRCSLKPTAKGKLAMRLLQLSPWYRWKGITTIRDEDGLAYWTDESQKMF